MKIPELTKRAIADITGGRFGKSGARFPDVNSVSATYGVSYVTALKLIGALKAEHYLIPLGNRNYIATGIYGFSSDLYRALNGASTLPRLGILTPSLVNPFFAAVTENLYKYLADAGFTPVITVVSPENEIDTMIRLVQEGCTGVFSYVRTESERIIDFYRRFPLPLVVVGKIVNGLNAYFVKSDNFESGVSAARHLIECGYERFAYIMATGSENNNDERLAGFVEGLSRDGQPAPNILVLDLADARTNNRILAKMMPILKNRRVGFFCRHDLLAISLMQLLKNNGVAIPENAGVVGYDNLENTLPSEILLTTFAYSFNKIAELSLSLMKEKLGALSPEARIENVQTILFVRESTAPRADG